MMIKSKNMKIFAIGMNYAAHNQELHGTLKRPDEPVIFTKADSALLNQGKPFFIPDQWGRIDYETEVVVRICRLGKNIPVRFAHRYYDALTVGIDFTARDLQSQCKAKGHPWEIAKAFDGSAPIGEFKKISELKHPEDINFGMKLNGKWVQQGHSHDMIFSFDKIVSHVSRFITLKEGDYIFTGTPQGVGEVHVGDKLELFLEDELMFWFGIN